MYIYMNIHMYAYTRIYHQLFSKSIELKCACVFVCIHISLSIHVYAYICIHDQLFFENLFKLKFSCVFVLGWGGASVHVCLHVCMCLCLYVCVNTRSPSLVANHARGSSAWQRRGATTTRSSSQCS